MIVSEDIGEYLLKRFRTGHVKLMLHDRAGDFSIPVQQVDDPIAEEIPSPVREPPLGSKENPIDLTNDDLALAEPLEDHNLRPAVAYASHVSFSTPTVMEQPQEHSIYSQETVPDDHPDAMQTGHHGIDPDALEDDSGYVEPLTPPEPPEDLESDRVVFPRT